MSGKPVVQLDMTSILSVSRIAIQLEKLANYLLALYHQAQGMRAFPAYDKDRLKEETSYLQGMLITLMNSQPDADSLELIAEHLISRIEVK